MLRGFVLGDQVRHESMETDTAVVRSEMDARPGLAEILDASNEIRRSHAVVKRDAADARPWRLPAVAARAEQHADEGQKGSLVAAGRLGKGIAERAPNFQRGAGTQAGHQPRHFADYEIHDIDADRLAAIVKKSVVQGERPPQQRIR